ncbi:hypothetical protein BDK51DRAFT_44474 [Blyttiomyces helicus]|uniref:RING-type domain-containing protein n=1 Tax=Blyttiomyces helicus TaxID=388810 RepID=A0A4P9WL68_9FUNG|nr:hypothetical protein BDK51DRAFT_44474 [Blyttiomyces helicus]|eukprot:RKO92338.1 hypothetical protein BDK51DRAFT_44474 [Blyttiomyces helicus]
MQGCSAADVSSIEEFFGAWSKFIPPAETSCAVELPVGHPFREFAIKAFKDTLNAKDYKVTGVSILPNSGSLDKYVKWKTDLQIGRSFTMSVGDSSTLPGPYFQTSSTLMNDSVLFHGTGFASLKGIVENGLSVEHSRTGCCGKGIYFSGDMKKCNVYSEARSQGDESRCTILSAIALGRVYCNLVNARSIFIRKKRTSESCPEEGTGGMVGPKCTEAPTGFDSVKDFNQLGEELVVYCDQQVIPIAAVFYEEVRSGSSNVVPRMNAMWSVGSNTNGRRVCMVLPPTLADYVQSFKKGAFDGAPLSGSGIKIRDLQVAQQSPLIGWHSLMLNMLTPMSLPSSSSALHNPSLPSAGYALRSQILSLQALATPAFFMASGSGNPHPAAALNRTPAKSIFGISRNPLLSVHDQMVASFLNNAAAPANIFGVPLADDAFLPNTISLHNPKLSAYARHIAAMGPAAPALESLVTLDFLALLESLDSYSGTIEAVRANLPPPPKPEDAFLRIDAAAKATFAEQLKEECSICLEDLDGPSCPDYPVKMKGCSHLYHEKCITTWIEGNACCPFCKNPTQETTSIGPMPDGQLLYRFQPRLTAYTILYHIPALRGNPGTTRIAVVPFTERFGNAVFIRLLAAFYYHHTFTVGTSVTTGRANQVV